LVLGNLSEDENSAILYIKNAIGSLHKIRNVYTPSAGFAERMNTALIELKDVTTEINDLFEKIESDPERTEIIKQRIDLIYGLQQKHHVSTVIELLSTENEYKNKID
jgi:DNA repair protein RecN (Recombination protein N)